MQHRKSSTAVRRWWRPLKLKSEIECRVERAARSQRKDCKARNRNDSIGVAKIRNEFICELFILQQIILYRQFKTDLPNYRRNKQKTFRNIPEGLIFVEIGNMITDIEKAVSLISQVIITMVGLISIRDRLNGKK